MFEQVCNQRIQRFDDNERDSDEDVWEEKEITYSPGMDSEKQRWARLISRYFWLSLEIGELVLELIS
jgi:hypothetical protein